MKKAFWICVVCVKLVASLPKRESQASTNSENQPQDRHQEGFQNPVPNCSTEQDYSFPQVGNADTPPHCLQQPGPKFPTAQFRGNQNPQLPVYYPHPRSTANVVHTHTPPKEYLPYHDYTQLQSHPTPYYDNYVDAAVQTYAPLHYGEIFHGNPQWLNYHNPNRLNTLARTQADTNSNVYETTKQPARTPASTYNNQPISKISTATETAGGSPGPKSTATTIAVPLGSEQSEATTTAIAGPLGSTSPVADITANAGLPDSKSPVQIVTATGDLSKSTATITATAGRPSQPQTIPPQTVKATKNTNDAIQKAANNYTAVINALQPVVNAAKNAPNAKAGTTEALNVNSALTVTPSSNPDLYNLSKLYKDAQDLIKNAYSAFGALKDKINYLAKKVQDNANSQPSTSSPPSPTTKPAQSSQYQSTSGAEITWSKEKSENPEATTFTTEDEEPTSSKDIEDFYNESFQEESQETITR